MNYACSLYFNQFGPSLYSCSSIPFTFKNQFLYAWNLHICLILILLEELFVIVHSLPYCFPSNCHMLYAYFAPILASMIVFPAPIPSVQQYIWKVSTLFSTSTIIFYSCNFSPMLFPFEFLYLKFSPPAELSRVFLWSLLKDRWVYSLSLDALSQIIIYVFWFEYH